MANKVFAKGKLLIVDDDNNFLKVLRDMFSSNYDTRVATSGLEALNILKEGFIPGVILSDQNMPEMRGSEFLGNSILISPVSTRIILTGFSNPRDIISCINEGHAWMYLLKPFEDVELVQAVKLGFEHYYQKLENQSLSVELNKSLMELQGKEKKLGTLLFENKSLFIQIFQAVSGLAVLKERYYFTPHPLNIASISNDLSSSMNLSHLQHSNLALSSLLQSSVLFGMPEEFLLKDPHELDVKDRMRYFQSFQSGVESLGQVKVFQEQAEIIAQIWERDDGTGFPNNLAGKDISYEAQIVSIANLYHNMVYRLPANLQQQFKKTGKIEQSAAETLHRHRQAMQFFRENVQWFNYSIYQGFTDLVKSGECKALIPSDEDFAVTYDEFEADISDDNHIAENEIAEQGVGSPDQKIVTDSLNISTDDDEDQAGMIKEEKHVSELKSDMIINQTISTKSGIVVVKDGSVLNKNLIKRIQDLEATGMIATHVEVLLPR